MSVLRRIIDGIPVMRVPYSIEIQYFTKVPQFPDGAAPIDRGDPIFRLFFLKEFDIVRYSCWKGIYASRIKRFVNITDYEV